MSFTRLIVFFSILFMAQFKGYSSHIVGGYIRYDFVSQNNNSTQYEVTVTLYRDVVRANPQAIFTPTIPLTIFTQGASSVVNLSRINTTLIADSIQDPCFVRIDSLQLEEAIYRGVVSLSSSVEHLLVYQRCCRNNSIDNLVPPTDDWGNTWTIEIPPFNTFGANSSPEFVENPPLAFCPSIGVNVNLSATDKDSDSLVYSLCAPFTSPQNNPEPNPATPPPYNFISFQAPQTPTNPIPAAPALSLDPVTGILTGNPTTLGQYVVGYCIEEYRNGVLLTTTRRDIQINTANCNPIILTAVQDQDLLCDGRTVQFTNNTPPVPGYTVQGYRWDFGDPTTLADTSRLENPSYTYPDTGLYTITLIANPGLRCSSSTSKDFLVYDKLDPQIKIEGLLCEDSNSVNFIAEGDYESYATLLWNFGPNASNPFSNQDTVQNIRFTGNQSSYTIQLSVRQDICLETRTATFTIDPNPIASFESDVQEICPPFPVNFTDRSLHITQADYIWDFGDGDSAFVPNPNHRYQNSGDYEVKLTVRTTAGCIDTVQFTDSIFASRSFSTNTIDFGISPREGCAPLQVGFFDSSNFIGTAAYFWDLDNNILSNDQNPSLLYADTGYYDVGLLLITTDSCADTLNLRVDSAIRVLPKPIAAMTIAEDTLSIKDALVEIDASMSQQYSRSFLFIDGSLVGQDPISSYRFQDTGKHQISWIVENDFNCSDTVLAEVYIFDQFEFLVPNVFTPNNDGINDVFKVKACGVYDYNIVIYNRYGKEVYRSNSLLSGWNGYINAEKASPGVYFYKIVIRDLNDEIRNYQGSVTLLYD